MNYKEVHIAIRNIEDEISIFKKLNASIRLIENDYGNKLCAHSFHFVETTRRAIENKIQEMNRKIEIISNLTVLNADSAV